MSIFDDFRCSVCGGSDFIVIGDKRATCTDCHCIFNNNFEIIYKGAIIKQREKQNAKPQAQSSTPTLISCPACGKKVSNQAQSCPDCGQPINTSPRCPSCGSTDVYKMDGLVRGLDIAMFGIFSSSINKTHKCRKCKTMW